MYAIEAQNVTKIIRGRTILNNVSLCVEQGEAVGIAGRNGSGKSMFFKTVCGLILPTSGSVRASSARPWAKTESLPRIPACL